MGFAVTDVKKCVKNVYYDPFKWSVVKSIGFFVLGVKIAVGCKGMNLMSPIS